MQMQLAFRHDVGWVGRYIIARVSGSPVHVALCFGENVVIEADGGVVREITRHERFADGEWTLVTCNLTAQQAWWALQFARGQVGKPYDWWGVLWAWWWGKPAGNAARDKWFCSELAAAALMAAGQEMGKNRAAYFTPRRLWDWCTMWRREELLNTQGRAWNR